MMSSVYIKICGTLLLAVVVSFLFWLFSSVINSSLQLTVIDSNHPSGYYYLPLFEFPQIRTLYCICTCFLLLALTGTFVSSRHFQFITLSIESKAALKSIHAETSFSQFSILLSIKFLNMYVSLFVCFSDVNTARSSSISFSTNRRNLFCIILVYALRLIEDRHINIKFSQLTCPSFCPKPLCVRI